MSVAEQWSHHDGPLTEVATRMTRWLRGNVLDGRLGLPSSPAPMGSSRIADLRHPPGCQRCPGGGIRAGPGHLPHRRELRDVRIPPGGRRPLDASTFACASTRIALAFRDSLWWLIGSRAAAAGVLQLEELIAVIGAIVFLVVLAVETVAGSYRAS
jgi:hypothetical protein